MPFIHGAPILVDMVSGFAAALSFMVIAWLQSELAILVVFAPMGSASFALYTCALTLPGESYTGGLLVAGGAVFALAYAIGSFAPRPAPEIFCSLRPVY